MRLNEIIDDPEVMAALDVEELGLRLLPWIAKLRQREIGIAIGDLREAYRGRPHGQAERALRETWTWLEGQALLIEAPGYIGFHQMRVLSRKASALIAQSENTGTASIRRIRKDELHPLLQEDVWSLYHSGKLDTAVFSAFKAVEVAVRSASGLADDLGINLMRKAFDKSNGPLSDLSMPEGEPEARAHLFAGAIGSYKNPHSHRKVKLDDSDEAAEIIMLANHLLRIVDTRRAVTGK